MGRRRADRAHWLPKYGVEGDRVDRGERGGERDYNGYNGGYTYASEDRQSRSRYDDPYYQDSYHRSRHSESRNDEEPEQPRSRREDDPNYHARRDKVRFDDADTAFILGRGGKTKQKIARVSGAQLELHERNNIVDIYGTEEECRKARKYIELVRAQRVGPVHVDATHDDGDLAMIDVPHHCVGFVTGAQGNFLRTCEDEWSTLMFFCDYQGPGTAEHGAMERLAIFGLRHGRAGAELKVMAAIETKIPGYFTKDVVNDQCAKEWGRDTMILGNEELSFALGKDGATRRKLAKASGCILEYVGNVAYTCGTLPERTRGREYLSWLIRQRTGSVFVDTAGRTDVTAVEVPTELTGILKGTTLRDLEHETDTFCFLEGDPDASDRLLIFGGQKGRRQADRKVRELVRVRPRQPPMEGDMGDRHRSEGIVKIDVRLGATLSGLVESEKLLAIQHACGARVTQNGSESVTIQGYDQQVSMAKKQLHEYMYSIKVEESFIVPKEIPLHVLFAKGPEGKLSFLEGVRNQTRVRVKVVQEEKKIVLGGLYSTVTVAKRDIQTFLGTFITHVLHLESAQVEKVSDLGKTSFGKLQHARHLCAANINKDALTLTISGTPDAVQECHACVSKLFAQEEWSEPTCEAFSMKHPMRVNAKADSGGSGRGSNKAAEILQLTENDSAFILGRGGKTKQKIARVSGAQLELHEQNNTVEIMGTDEERRRARKYLELVRAQRVGPVNVDETHDDGDLKMISVPHSCVGFVTGSQGNFLRTCEEEWGTLMFFCDYQGPTADGGGGIERLAIFGTRTGRTGAELKVMAAIETKISGYFTRDVVDNSVEDEWGQDTLPLGNDELSFALGKDGSTRKKLARASGCILEYVGHVAYMAGTLAARGRVRDYLSWLMKQRTGTVYVEVNGRSDVTVVDIPEDLEGVASVFKSMTLRSIEQETRTFCFLEGNASKSDRLLIFSHEKAGREKAKHISMDRIMQRMQNQDAPMGPSGQRWVNTHHQESKHRERHHPRNYHEGGGGGYHHSGGGYGHGGWHGGGGGYDPGSSADVTDHFALRGDISVHVVIQTGPGGEDPVIEEVEHMTKTKLTLMREKGVVQIQGPAEKVAQAKRQLQQFADRFVSCKVQLRPEITCVLANKVSHYIRPMPWISAADVDETKNILKIQGHQDSIDKTFNVLRDLYKDQGLELLDSEIVVKKKAVDDHSFGHSRPSGKGKNADIIRVGEDDAAFILGRGGKTKHKIARVSGAQLELHERNNTVEIFGGDDERRKARKYIELVRAQRVGPVNVSDAHDDGDLTMIAVPQNCVGFVTGSQGNFLRSCEEEWGTLMFFCDYQGPTHDGIGGAERLAIFGLLGGRCGAELKVMAAIETKIPGYFTKNLGETRSPDDWGTDTVPMNPDQLSYALGKKGSTRRKLARASGCIIEYVGSVAFLAGNRPSRKRAKEYLIWLCDQVCCKSGRISIDATSRDDCTLVPVPKDCIGYVMGDKRATLSRLEEDWNTLIFFVDSKCLPTYQDVEGLAIFGDERGRAGTELKVMGAVETKLPQFFTKGVGDFQCTQDWGVDTLPLGNEELSFALGKDGNTRKKLARASGGILEYVGNIAYMAGMRDERLRAREYLKWLMKQRHGTIVVDIKGRKDVSVIEIPHEMKGMVKASTLRDVERETGTFCFIQGDVSTSNTLLVCGHKAQDRVHAEAILQDILVRGSTRPRPRRRTDGGHHGPPAPAESFGRKAAAVRPPIDESSEDSDSGSETGSESDYSTQSDDKGPDVPPSGGGQRGHDGRGDRGGDDDNAAEEGGEDPGTTAWRTL